MQTNFYESSNIKINLNKIVNIGVTQKMWRSLNVYTSSAFLSY